MQLGQIDSPCSDAAGAQTPPIFQVDELLRRCMGDHWLASTLIERFTARLASTIQDIERSLAEGDRRPATSLVHKLKGEAGNLSAADLHRCAAALEDCLRAGRHAETELHFGRLKSAAEQCCSARSSALKQLRSLNSPASEKC
jgi:HPt (histidine-containing phosphotransfer) domain-containing protein